MGLYCLCVCDIMWENNQDFKGLYLSKGNDSESTIIYLGHVYILLTFGNMFNIEHYLI
jgi:hypothetical protein